MQFLKFIFYVTGPLHQSEEELLSPNEDLGPEARCAHKKLLTSSQYPGLLSEHSQHYFYDSTGTPIVFKTPQMRTDQPAYINAQTYLTMTQPSIDPDSSTRAILGNNSLDSTFSTEQSGSSTTSGCVLSRSSLQKIQQKAEAKAMSQPCSVSSSLTSTTTTTDHNCGTCSSDISYCNQCHLCTIQSHSHGQIRKPSIKSSHHPLTSENVPLFDDNSSTITSTTEDDLDYHHCRLRPIDGDPDQQSDDIGHLDLSPDGDDNESKLSGHGTEGSVISSSSATSSPSTCQTARKKNFNIVFNSTLNNEVNDIENAMSNTNINTKQNLFSGQELVPLPKNVNPPLDSRTSTIKSLLKHKNGKCIFNFITGRLFTSLYSNHSNLNSE